MSETAEGLAYWGEVDPKTATIVGAFGQVPVDIFGLEKITASAASYGFGLASEEVMPTQKIVAKAYAELRGEAYQDDPESIQKTIIDQLRECEPDERRAVLDELGELAAGSSDVVTGLIETIDEKVAGDRPYRTIPLLRALSTLALHRIAATEIRPGTLSFAPSPRGMDHHPAFREPRPAA